MTIVVWGVDHGICAPYSGSGFRKEFVLAKDADMYIKLQCNAIDRKELEYYAIYITNECIDLDIVMYYHNRSKIDKTIGAASYGIEVVNVEQIKNHIDLEYQAFMRQQAMGKANIDAELRNMSRDDIEREKKLFREAGINHDRT